MATSRTRQKPNILITGTPGTGKSTLAPKVAQYLGFQFIDIAQTIKDEKLHAEFDEEYNSYVLDEDKLLDFLQERMDSKEGGVVLDYHSSDFFPQRWFDFIIVLRCPNTQIIYDRLALREGYSSRKITENVQCEIFGAVFEEALEAYPKEIVYEMSNETNEQMVANISEITKMASEWKPK